MSTFLDKRPIVTTERLELWMPTREDISTMHAIVSEPETKRYLGPSSEESEHFVRFCRNAGSWLLYGYGGFIVRFADSGEVIGNCGVFHSHRGLGEDFDDNPEAGWILRADSVGKGFGREAMTAAFEWFDRRHGARRVVCMIAPDNAASIALAEKLSFSAMRDTALPDGEEVRLFERLPQT